MLGGSLERAAPPVLQSLLCPVTVVLRRHSVVRPAMCCDKDKDMIPQTKDAETIPSAGAGGSKGRPPLHTGTHYVSIVVHLF